MSDVVRMRKVNTVDNCMYSDENSRTQSLSLDMVMNDFLVTSFGAKACCSCSSLWFLFKDNNEWTDGWLVGS